MKTIEKDTMQALHSLQGDPRFHKLIELLEDEYEFNLKGLLTASRDKLQPLQGKTAILSELLTLLKTNR